jgi:hypothetical protein
VALVITGAPVKDEDPRSPIYRHRLREQLTPAAAAASFEVEPRFGVRSWSKLMFDRVIHAFRLVSLRRSRSSADLWRPDRRELPPLGRSSCRGNVRQVS